jgi:hypothetical protein
MKSTEELRDDIMQIRKDLRSGVLSNAVARTLLQGAKHALETTRLEMEAQRLGCEFTPVYFKQEDRAAAARSKIRAVA